MPIHHIDMNPVGARGLDGTDFVAQLGEIGRKNRRRDNKRAHKTASRRASGNTGSANGQRRACKMHRLVNVWRKLAEPAASRGVAKDRSETVRARNKARQRPVPGSRWLPASGRYC